MNIIDRFSTHLKEVLIKSIKIATELNNEYVEPLHFLLALSMQKGSMANELLNRFNIDQKSIERAIINFADEAETKNYPRVCPLSFDSKNLIEKALIIAQKNNHNYLGTEHLLAALVKYDQEWLTKFFKKNLKSADLENQVDLVLSNSTLFPPISESSEVVDRMNETLGDESFLNNAPMAPIFENKQKKKDSSLDFFAVNLTAPQIQSSLDPVVGRENEIERMMQILCRRTKNNPVLLGDPGVGKTAIVEGLAKKLSLAMFRRFF